MLAPAGEADSAPASLLQSERQLAAAGRFDEAIAAAEAAITAAQGVTADREAVPYLYDDMAQWTFELRRTEAALQLEESELSAAQAEFGAQSARLRDFRLHVALRDYEQGQCRAALQLYDEVYAFSRGNPSLVAESAISLGELYRDIGDNGQADKVWSDALGNSSLSPAAKARLHVQRANAALDNYQLGVARDEAAAAGLDLTDKAMTTDPVAILVKARLARAQGDLATSRQILAQATGGRCLRDLQQDSSLRPLCAELAVNQGLLGQYTVAEQIYRQLLGAYPGFGSDSPPITDAYYELGWVYQMLGDDTQSEVYFERALHGYETCAGGHDWRTANLLIERSRLYLDEGKIDEALVDSQRAADIVASLKGDWRVMQAYTIAARSFALARVGQLDAARQAMIAADNELEAVRGPNAEDLAPGYVELAEISLLQQNAAETRRWASLALTLRQRANAESLWGTGTALSLLAAADGQDRQWDRYLDESSQFSSVVDDYVALAQGADELIQDELRRSRLLFERVIDPLAHMDPARIERSYPLIASLLQLPQLSVAGAAVRESAEAVAAGDADLQTLVKHRLELSEQWQAESAQLADAVNHDQSEAAAAPIASKLADIRRQIDTLDPQIRARAPALADLLTPRPVKLSDVQPLIRPDEAVLLQFITGSTAHALLIRRSDVEYRSTNLDVAVVRRDVSRLRRALDLGLPLSERLPFDDAAAHELYRGSIGMFESALADVHELTVIPDDAYQNIPWSVFRIDDPASRAGSASATARYIADRYALSVMPTLGAFVALRTRSAVRTTGSRPFIGFGDPVLTGTAGASGQIANSLTLRAAGSLDATALADLPPLPQTADELEHMAQTLGAASDTCSSAANLASQCDVFIEQAATPQRVSEMDLTPYRVISFATHGLLAGDFRGLVEPALVLSPPAGSQTDPTSRLLRASDIAKLRIDAELVILSACNTGRPDEQGGAGGLSSLARAFFAAGAQSLLVSHWSVSSAATDALLTHTVELMRQHSELPAAEALREAAVWMKSGGAGDEYRSPAFWAPFVLVGDSQPLVIGGQGR